MVSNPFLGLLFHWIGGLASASFYIPYRGVKKWAWETYWLVGGFFSWIIAPGFFALLMTKDLPAVLSEVSPSTLFWTYFFGVLWGTGGLTFGLTMRYLGISLGMAVALGFCAAFGTLVPPIFDAFFVPNSPSIAQVFGTNSGMAILLGVVVCFAGIGVSGMAGMTKGLPVLVVVLLGGFTTNFIWCLFLNIRNRTGGQYFSAEAKGSGSGPILETAIDAPGEEMACEAHLNLSETTQVPLIVNYLLCAIAGVTWYFQFFFYTMGESQMGQYKFSSWTLHMASIIIFSTLWGLALKEWRGASGRAMTFLVLSLAVLVGSTVIIGYGNYLATLAP